MIPSNASPNNSSLPSRRKQAKPQRLSNEATTQMGISLANGHGDQLPDYHVCGHCLMKFCNVEKFMDHKKSCSSMKQESITPPLSDTESVPIDLSRKGIQEDVDKKNVLEDRSNIFFNPFTNIQDHQQKLLELYAQLAASQSVKSDSEHSSEDNFSVSYIISPPSSNDAIDRVHPCAADGCTQRFSSRGALLWHVLRRHPEAKLFQCECCNESQLDYEQARDHRCSQSPRPHSANEILRSSSPDADRGSVPAQTGGSFSLTARSPSPPISSLNGLSAPVLPHLSHVLFSRLFNSPPTAVQHPLNASKDSALDLSTPSGSQSLLNIPKLPPQLVRPSLPFGVQQPIPANANFLGGVPTASSSMLDNDDDWEALMEVTTTDEAEKIRALVGDKALPTTDPNQCLLCRRVLSCKSALQMHYRTHTGERPFKCKICQRAFTTKGNLKTHMGVHRAKHSIRGISSTPVQHQCPICQKRFFTPQLLQHHITQHTSQLSRNSLGAAFDSPLSSCGYDRAPISSSSQSVSSPLSAPPLPLNPHLLPSMKGGLLSPFSGPFPFLPMPYTTEATPPFSSALQLSPSSCFPKSSLISPVKKEGVSDEPNSVPQPTTPVRIDTVNNPRSLEMLLNSTFRKEEPKKDEHNNDDFEPNTSNTSVFPTIQCPICSKSFASKSAMELHMRCSHNKDRGVKCSECSQSVSNNECLRQHMLVYHTQGSLSPDEEPSDEAMTTKHSGEEGTSDADQRIKIENDIGLENNSEAEEHGLSNSSSTTKFEDSSITEGGSSNCTNPLDAMQKMWAETEPPPPRQAPVLSKHQCGVCFKHFSSSSALQIHMRTHTGDKPFKCEVCGRAFTTRGNLKVHMGTHMWQQNPSRRGRRIFEFGEGCLRPDLVSPLSDTSIRPPFDSALRSPFDLVRAGPPAFLGLPFPLPMIPSSSSMLTNSSQVDAMMWMWRTVCSVCQKVCSSPQELERHLKMHLNGTASAARNSSTMLLQKSE